MPATLDLRGVHQYDKVPGSPGQFRLAHVSPYVRLSCEGRTLFVQKGMVFAEEGGPLGPKEIPEWFHEEVKKVNPAVLAECGWRPKA